MLGLEKNSEHTVTIESYNSSGSGVARIDGLVVFVKGAINGEVLRIRILKVTKGAAFAKIVDIITPSSHRIIPACESFGKCGGCDFLHMDYAEELELKRRRVEDSLKRIGGFDISVAPVVPSEAQEEYRNKAIFAIENVDGHAIAGFYRERSHDIIPAENCLIQTDVSRRAAVAVTRWMDSCGIPAYDEKTHKGAIRRVFCRYAAGTDTAQVVITTADKRLNHLDQLIDEIKRSCPEAASIILNVNKTHGNTVLAGSFRTIWGEDAITDELCGLKFKLSPRSFYQINRVQAEKLYLKALELTQLSDDDLAVDLYCGAGTITLLLAQSAGRVIGADITDDAIIDARENAERNGIRNAEFICADASAAAEQLKNTKLTPAAVVVDPPRRGLTPDVIQTISDMSPKRVVYVSCDPATLARDLRAFCDLGYELSDVTAFDMFPRCAHVETVALLRKNDIKCYVCDEFLDKNTHLEHIIPNAIGGFLKSKKLICNACNGKLGKIDSKLSDQLLFISNMIGIKRDRGKSPSFQTSDGIGYIKPGGEFILHKPTIRRREIKILEGGAEISANISAPPSKMDEQIKSIENELRQKGVPEEKISEVINTANAARIRYYQKNSTSISFDLGDDGFRAITKIAVNFFIHKGGDAKHIKHLLPYIQNNEEIECVNFYYPEMEIIENRDNDILHSIIIIGNKKQKLLYAYVELFNFHKCVVLLSTEYEGDCFCENYFLNVLNAPNTTSKKFNLCISKKALINAVQEKEFPINEFKSAYGKLMAIVHKKWRSNQLADIVERSFNKFPKGILMNEEMFNELMKELIPFIVSQIPCEDDV
ncbi:MAG: 23S rRNA (uracil(1939)-C(5))-methyltransferase RlmD [Oscillospiraceae bacterium]|nr:23S rRNA (uracil(1939)-C(5))-methyltransferase RlmD [Oscillospiraceae bacterium]